MTGAIPSNVREDQTDELEGQSVEVDSDAILEEEEAPVVSLIDHRNKSALRALPPPTKAPPEPRLKKPSRPTFEANPAVKALFSYMEDAVGGVDNRLTDHMRDDHNALTQQAIEAQIRLDTDLRATRERLNTDLGHMHTRLDTAEEHYRSATAWAESATNNSTRLDAQSGRLDQAFTRLDGHEGRLVAQAKTLVGLNTGIEKVQRDMRHKVNVKRVERLEAQVNGLDADGSKNTEDILRLMGHLHTQGADMAELQRRQQNVETSVSWLLREKNAPPEMRAVVMTQQVVTRGRYHNPQPKQVEKEEISSSEQWKLYMALAGLVGVLITAFTVWVSN